MKNPTLPKKNILVLFFSLAVLFQSCIKEEYNLSNIEEGTWNPDVAIPLVFTSFSIDDIILKTDKNANINTDQNKFCTLIYKGTLFSINAEDFIVLPTTNAATSFVFNGTEAAAFNALPPGSSITFNKSQLVNFLPGTTNAQLDSIIYSSGDINFDLNKSFNVLTTIELNLPSLKKKNGFSYFTTIPLQTGTTQKTISLDSTYTFDLTNGGTSTNQFLVNYKITLTKNNGNLLVAGDNFSVTESVSNQKFKTVFGFVGTQSSLTPNEDTVAISIFRHQNTPIGIGSFHFENPLLKLYLVNSFGLPVGISNIDLKWYNPGLGQGTIAYTTTPLQVNAPTVVGGAEISDTLKLNNSNSDFNAVMDNHPKYIIYKVASETNPTTMPVQKNFIDAGSKLKANVEVELPMYGSAKDFTFEDTIKFRFQKVENVETILFKAFATNDFPMGIKMQIYFTDTLYTILDSLFTSSSSSDPTNVLPSAAITFNSDGSQSSIPSSKVTDVFFDEVRTQRLKNAKHIIIRAVSATFDNGSKNVKIYSDKRLSVKLGARAQMNIKIK